MMINEITISNYKSAIKTSVPLTPFTVLIGENGAGKSNILEALVLAAAAGSDKLDTEYLSARGVRLCNTLLTKSAFSAQTKDKPITIDIETHYVSEDGASLQNYHFVLQHDDRAAKQWTLDPRTRTPIPTSGADLEGYWKKYFSSTRSSANKEALDELNRFIDMLKRGAELAKEAERSLPEKGSKPTKKASVTMEIKTPLVQAILGKVLGRFTFERFTVYSPLYEVLRNHLALTPTSPLGPRGEGLLATLLVMKEDEPDRFQQVTSSLELFGWFQSIDLPSKDDPLAASMPKFTVTDKYIKRRGIRLDDGSVNEGFLFVLFYLTLVCSSKTPSVFAIENIETALNPRLCEVLVKRLVQLSKRFGKQVILTTHNPAVLDALNLDDKLQSLVIVRRTLEGHTIADRYRKPATGAKLPVKLSEAFLRGHIGALPKGI
jgi:predicted ATPase